MKKRFALFIAIISLLAGACNDRSSSTPAPTIAIGTPKASFEKLVTELGAEDIGKDMAIVGPRAGKIWEFADYGVVVSVSYDDTNKISRIDYCPIADFTVSKSHRANSTVAVTKLTFDETIVPVKQID